MKRVSFVTLSTLLTLVMIAVYSMEQRLIVPISIMPKIVVEQKNPTLEKLRFVGIDSLVIAESVDIAAKRSKLSKEFLIALMYTESEGHIMAKSCKGYKGLMQIPDNVYYPDANMLIGAHKFNEKMKIAKRDVIKALCLYKGFPVGSDEGKEAAKSVLRLQKRLKSVEVADERFIRKEG